MLHNLCYWSELPYCQSKQCGGKHIMLGSGKFLASAINKIITDDDKEFADASAATEET